MQAKHEVAEVIERLWPIEQGFNHWQLRTLNAIRRCRTAALGGHIDACDGCGNISISYNSCRNRHCPKCQGEKREEWIAAREAELLPCPYFHVVFTLPSELNQLAMYEPKVVYDTLFEATWQTIKVFGKDPKHLQAPINKGIKNGMVAVLHTWGQNLSLHPHLHCIIPGGGVDERGIWRFTRAKGKFLYPVKALSLVFRAKYVAILRSKLDLDQGLYDCLFKKRWVVYAKRPFGNPKSVVEYLGRYTHKVAISNRRILSIDSKTVTFSYKDYKGGAHKKEMTLSHKEFIRRFSQHILPKRLVRIRHYGILSSTWKRGKLGVLQEVLWKKTAPPKPVKAERIRVCPCCKTGNLRTILSFDYRGPPESYRQLWFKLNSSSKI
jgi:hypothetical protein